MRTALIAGLAAGTFLLNSVWTQAADASSLRGLKLPRTTLEAYSLGDRPPGAGWGLKPVPFETAAALAPRVSHYAGRTEARQLALGSSVYSAAHYTPAGYLPPSAPLGDFGPARDLLPKSMLYSHASRTLPGGWGVGFGIRQSEYSVAAANLTALSAERQWGSIRGGYTLYAHWLDGSSTGSAHRFQLSYAYGDRNTIGLSYTTGRDVDTLALPVGVGLADVRDFALSGRHWLTTNWALTYDVSHEQSVLHRRQGLRLGVSRSF